MFEMSISYNKLWKLLIDKKMSQADFRRTVAISHSTLTKLRRDEAVSMEILMKICGIFDCNVGDILDFIKISDGGGSK
jgi:DNA-binding Xre family transcriptional regulator